jgi:hypothetical protein
LYMIIEGVLIALIIWNAWKWPKVQRHSAVGN